MSSPPVVSPHQNPASSSCGLHRYQRRESGHFPRIANPPVLFSLCNLACKHFLDISRMLVGAFLISPISGAVSHSSWLWTICVRGTVQGLLMIEERGVI